MSVTNYNKAQFTLSSLSAINMPFQHNGKLWNLFQKTWPSPTVDDYGNSGIICSKMSHELIWGTSCKSKKIRMRICNKYKFPKEQYPPINRWEDILYQASSRSAIIPMGFCKTRQKLTWAKRKTNSRNHA